MQLKASLESKSSTFDVVGHRPEQLRFSLCLRTGYRRGPGFCQNRVAE